jgi:hypothetical protein
MVVFGISISPPTRFLNEILRIHNTGYPHPTRAGTGTVSYYHSERRLLYSMDSMILDLSETTNISATYEIESDP